MGISAAARPGRLPLRSVDYPCEALWMIYTGIPEKRPTVEVNPEPERITVWLYNRDGHRLAVA